MGTSSTTRVFLLPLKNLQDTLTNQQCFHSDDSSIFCDTSREHCIITYCLKPKLFIDPSGQHEFIIVIPVDANWAGCSKTRKSISRVLIKFLGVLFHCISNKTICDSRVCTGQWLWCYRFRPRRRTSHPFRLDGVMTFQRMSSLKHKQTQVPRV